MTYRQLLEVLQAMPQDRLEDDVSVYVCDSDEYYPVEQVSITDDFSDVLDPGHIYLETAFPQED